MRIHRIYCKSVSETNNVFKIDQAQSMHLTKVLRLDVNEEVEVFDGNGSSAICKILESNRSSVSLERVSDIKTSKAPINRLGFILPFIKKENFHFMIQKLCEIGATEFIFYKPDLIDQSIAKKEIAQLKTLLNEFKLGFRFIFQSNDRTLTDKEIDKVINVIIDKALLVKSIKIPGLK